MDRNTVTGLLLMVLFFVGYTYFFTPDEEPKPITETIQAADSSQVDMSTSAADDPGSLAPAANVAQETDSARAVRIAAENASRWGIFSPSAQGSEGLTFMQNEKVKVAINSKGGLFYSAELEQFQSFWEKENIELWHADKNQMDIWFEYRGKGKMNMSDLYFTKVSEEKTDSSQRVVMRLQTNDPGKYLDYIYELNTDAYVVNLQIQAIGLDQTLDLPTGQFNWSSAGKHNEKGIAWERQHSAIYFREMGQGRDYLGDGREDDEVLERELNWMAFKQNYFSAAVINREGFAAGADIKSNPPTAEEDTTVNMFYDAKLPMPMLASANSVQSLEFYFGPNELNELKSHEVEEFDRIIDYGWFIFGWVNRWLILPVFNWLTSFISSIGIAILVITIMIKLLLSPITWKNFMSSAKMRVLRPEIEQINEKHKDDAMAKQQATMALYRETGVNPFAGCLPMLLQLPILYAMFRFFPANIDLRGGSFLWADDLGAYDAIISWSQHIPVVSTYYGNHVSGFTVMMAVSTFFYTRLSSANMPNAQQPGMPNMKVIMNIFPLFMLVFFNKFAAGLSFYYFCSNLLSIGQMVLIKNYLIDEDKIREKIEKNKATPKKKSNFQQRLEEMQKLQQENAKKNKKK
ncbi:MAG: membrane protein insertase YidC [Flavobacteriales bacterium]|nr:membrane protein insertase YidC [Flavobacteriales bacterium]